MAVAEAQETLPAPVGSPNPWQGLLRLNLLKQVGLMVGLAASVALGAAVILWSQTPAYSLLYGSLSPDSANEVAQALELGKVPFRLEAATGSITVPVDRVHDARFMLAAQGLPKSNELGFEVLEQEQGFGTSQFVERARFQRALEVELARSVTTVDGVRSARVHLAVPKQSVFVRNRQAPTASVLLSLSAGGRLGENQVSAIAHMVAAAVPNLQAANVKVVDQKGRLLTPEEMSADLALTKTQFDHVRRVEADYVKRVRDILSPLVGPDGVEAQVTADMDFTRMEQTRETYNPDLPALRSEQILEEQGNGGFAGGIPGALSNQPPGTATVPEQTSGDVEAKDGGQTAGSAPRRKRATRNYEIDRTVSHTVMPFATIKRLSVAVVVDHFRRVGADGNFVREALGPEDLTRVESLVKEAVGFVESRGDSVKVTNVAFSEPLDLPPPPELPTWRQPWVMDVAKQAAGVLLVLLMVFAVLRPAMRRLTGTEAQEREIARLEQESAAKRAGGARDGLEPDQLHLSQEEALLKLPDHASNQKHIDMVRSMVNDDPRRVAQVVRGWVTEDE